ncbi:MAG: PLP-dependent aminotransferase family protein, partial [Deltaproteobacteria bacterium]|nr:PLP-dependent aminotransferase family protein [Deltaproteobacteria bacterium]
MLDLAFRADRARPEPVYRQLEDFLRELIATRRLASGERLPSTRDLARDLGLSRNTVNLAFEALAEDGLLHSHVGRGTFVAGDAAPAARPPLRSVGGRSVGVHSAERARRGFAWGGLFARRTRAVKFPDSFHGATPPEPRFDFRGGQVDLGTLPRAELKAAFSRALSRDLPELADAVDPRGWPPLREAIARSLVARGIQCDADEVAVVNGAQQALDLVARVLVDPGDTVAMEQPGYFGGALAFSASEGHLVGVGVDAEGMRTDELARLLRARRVKLVYTTPAVQSPTGVVMSDARRRHLLALADEYQVPLVEDDYDSELRYGRPPVPALKNLDEAGQVIYVGTFSKALFAGLRVGYAVAARPLIRRLVLSRWASDFNTDVVTQAALAQLLASGGLERHVRRQRRLYTARREALLAALADRMPEGTRWIEPAGGNAVWVTLPAGSDGRAVCAAARERGIAYATGDLFFLDGSGHEHLSLCFGRVEAERMDEGIRELAALVKRQKARARRSA